MSKFRLEILIFYYFCKVVILEILEILFAMIVSLEIGLGIIRPHHSDSTFNIRLILGSVVQISPEHSIANLE